MTDEEVAWMGVKKRRGKPIRVYRAATLGNLAAFRFHTNVEHALRDLPEGTMRANLFTGEVAVDSIIFRLMEGGQKIVIVSPDRVKAIKVQELVHPDAVTLAEAAGLQGMEDALELADNIDALEEKSEDHSTGAETTPEAIPAPEVAAIDAPPLALSDTAPIDMPSSVDLSF
jgi:hypothetical protein